MPILIYLRIRVCVYTLNPKPLQTKTAEPSQVPCGEPQWNLGPSEIAGHEGLQFGFAGRLKGLGFGGLWVLCLNPEGSGR